MEQATGRAQDKRDRDQEENMEANWLAGHFQDAQALVSKGRKQNDPCVSAKEDHGRVNKREEQKRDESKRGSESEGDSDSDGDGDRDGDGGDGEAVIRRRRLGFGLLPGLRLGRLLSLDLGQPRRGRRRQSSASR